MADCTKTVEFLREWSRMCDAHEECATCPLDEPTSGRGCDVCNIPDDAIAIVQKWSDEHPVMTWAGKLKELLPNADIGSIIESGCPHEYFGSVAPIPSGDCTVLCADCWNGEYKEK